MFPKQITENCKGKNRPVISRDFAYRNRHICCDGDKERGNFYYRWWKTEEDSL